MKKKKLILIQPPKYNELFSTYHNSKKSKKYLPEIPSNFQKEWEITSYTTKSNNFDNRQSFSTKKNYNIFRRNNELLTQLKTHQNSLDNNYKYDFLPFPSLRLQYKKTDEKSKTKKKFEIKKSNFNVIYLNLSHRTTEYTNKSSQEYSVEAIDKNQIVNEKTEEINKIKNNKIKEIILKNEKSKIMNDLSKIKKMPIVLINFIAEDIYNNMKLQNPKQNNIINNKSKNFSSQKNIGSDRNICNFDNINKTIYKNNTFFQFILDNVKRKIEIINDTNKSITILTVMNLINSELEDLKKNLENYEINFLLNNSHFNSNNISKSSNNDITSSNTFRFKTNSNTNNNSGVLGNLIKKDIYGKTNNGSKKMNFENNININGRNRENLIFQNQEIIYSINQEESKGYIKSKNIKKIDIKKYLKNKKAGVDAGTNIEREKIFVTKSNNNSPVKIRSKNNFFHKVNLEEKKIARSFSEIFLKKNYQKESDFINEVSNEIEKTYYIKKKKEKKIFYQDKKVQSEFTKSNCLKKKEKINSYLEDSYSNDEKDNNNNKYEYIREPNIITPIKNKNFLQTFSDNQEKKTKIRNKKLRNNYQNIILNIEQIKQEKSIKPHLTPKKARKFKNKKNQTDTSSTLNDGQISSENQEPNLIYFDKKRKKEIIYENENEVRKQNKNKKKGKNKNKDLTSIKSSKNSEKNIFRKSFNKNKLNIDNNDQNDNDIIIKDNKNKKKNRKKNQEIASNIINNNPEFENQNELIKQNKINEDFEEEENENDEEYDEDEDEEDEEEEEDVIIENGTNQSPITQKSKKRKKTKNKDNKIMNKEKKKKRKKTKEKGLTKNPSIEKNKNKRTISKNDSDSLDEKVIPEYSHKNKEIDFSEPNSPKMLGKDSNKYLTETNNELVIKKKKSKIDGGKKLIDLMKKRKSQTIEEELTENTEYQELIKEMEKYNVQSKKDLYNVKHLTKDKKAKNSGGGLLQNITDNSFFLFDENINDILKKNLPSGNTNIKNFNKQEELKILGEVAELENLTEEEKSFALSELLDLRNIIIKAKVINKEIKEQINKKRMILYKLVNKFFINYILDDIKNETVVRDKYTNKLNKLEKIQNFGIFTYKNLGILEIKFIIPYFDKLEKRKKAIQEKEDKILRQKAALEEFENYKKKLEQKRKSQLIYDNSYLFKKKKAKEFKLRKEVEDLLNKEYQEYQQNENTRSNKRLQSLIKKRKKTDKRKKISNNHNNQKLKRLQLLDEETEENIDEKNLEKELEEQKEEELKDKKLKEFFEKIRKLKSGEFKDFDEELNQLINEIMLNKDAASRNKENRINSFMQNFELNRMKNQARDKFYNKGYNFVSPIRFTSENKIINDNEKHN